MAFRPQPRPRPSRPTIPDDSSSDSELDPSDLSDDDDLLHDGTAPEKPNQRVIIHLDVDCHEAQVWIKEKRPELENRDVPVVVANFDKIILAVNYPGKVLGIERGNGRRYLEKMEQRYPQLIAITTGEMFGKQDCFTPQKRSDDIFQVLLDYQKTLKDSNSIIMERPSKDEVYIDVTNLVKLRSKPAWFDRQLLRPPPQNKVDQLTSATKTHPNAEYKGKPVVVMEGYSETIYGRMLNKWIMDAYPWQAEETCLAHGASIALTIIKLIKKHTGFDASAGVAHNKLLAKLACDASKPQGITIFTNVSIPRVSKELEFKDIPGYGGKRGQDLLTYFATYFQQKGQKVTTLHYIISLPLDDLIAAFKAVGSSDAESDAKALIDKCHGQDESLVRQRYFTDTINASINFKGTHSVKKWNEFKYRVMSLSFDLSNRIEYSIERWNRFPHSLVVKATMRKGSNVTPAGEDNSMKIDGFVDELAINGFIMQYIKANGLEFGGIEGIKVTASDFKVSSVDEGAKVPAANDHAFRLAASSPVPSEPEEHEDKIMSIEFKGANRLDTLNDLSVALEDFSEEIARQIDFYITMDYSCPRELVVNVSLFDGARSKIQWTKKNSLCVCMVVLPDPETIQEFIFEYVEENNINARQIKARCSSYFERD